MSNILQMNHLSKTIGKKELVSDVSLQIKKGEIYGFLGPNGAGKTTVMKMLLNLWKPTSGEIILFDEILTPTSYEVLKRIGSIIEYPVFYEELNGRENLTLHCEYMGYYSPNSTENALELLGLSDTGNKPVRSYSLGMRQRLSIARAILTKPEFLVLDEPTNGLDPAGIKQIRDLLKMLCKEYGVTIMISSHLLSEVANIITTMGIIVQGHMVKEISMNTFTEMNMAYIELRTPDTKHAAYTLEEELKLSDFRVISDNTIRIYDRNITTQTLSRAFAMNEVPIDYLNRQSESLEDYFLKITEEGK